MQSHRTSSGYVARGGDSILFFLSIIYIFLLLENPHARDVNMDFSLARALFYICIYVFKKETTLSDNYPRISCNTQTQCKCKAGISDGGFDEELLEIPTAHNLRDDITKIQTMILVR